MRCFYAYQESQQIAQTDFLLYNSFHNKINQIQIANGQIIDRWFPKTKFPNGRLLYLCRSEIFWKDFQQQASTHPLACLTFPHEMFLSDFNCLWSLEQILPCKIITSPSGWNLESTGAMLGLVTSLPNVTLKIPVFFLAWVLELEVPF